jgi:dipeptidase E
MRLLLTSAGIKNTSIHDALVDLLGKRLAESSAPTRTQVPHVRAGLEVLGRAGAHRAAQHRRRAVDPHGRGDRRPAGEWRRCLVSVLLDATVGTGGPLAVAARSLGGLERREPGDGPQRRGGLRRLEAAQRWRRRLGLVDFSMFPHLDNEDLPDNRMAHAEKWAASVPVPGYAIDDQTAIKVTDGAVEVVSEVHWKLFTPQALM